jgi:predicted DNA-binding transcriptional regulator AlpA
MNDKTDGRGRRNQSQREVVLQGFVDLPSGDQLWVWRRIAEVLELADGSESDLDRKVRERAETLEALRLASQHLGLDRPPTVNEYEEARKALGLEWSSARIGRVWGRWTEASAALAGEPRRATAAERAHRRTYLGRRRRRVEPVRAVRIWLASGAKSDYAVDYDAWAREHNLHLEEGELPLPRRTTIARNEGLAWRELLAVARGERTEAEVKAARRELGDWSRGPHDLVSVTTIAHMIDGSRGQAIAATHRNDFPRPVAIFGGKRAWLRGDVEARLRGVYVEREENEHRHLYMDTNEAADALGVKYQKAVSRPDVPPAGRVGGKFYWLREEIEAWAGANSRRIEERRKRAARPGAAPPPKGDFVSAKEIGEILSASPTVVRELALDPRFPKPVAQFGRGRIWLRRDVESYAVGRPFPVRAASALQEKLIESGALSEMLGLNRAYTQGRRRVVPPPAGSAGEHNFWVQEEIEAWLDKDPKRRQEVKARRQRRATRAGASGSRER